MANSKAYDMNNPLRWMHRCDVCGWPLESDRSKGCAEFDCSMRPQPDGYGLTHSERLAARAEIRRLETALRVASAEGARKQERIDELEVRCQELGTLYEQWKETSHKQNELLDMYAERPSSESETIGWCKSCGSDNLELWMADGSAYVCKRCGFEKDHHCTDPMCGPLNSEQEQT